MYRTVQKDEQPTCAGRVHEEDKRNQPGPACISTNTDQGTALAALVALTVNPATDILEFLATSGHDYAGLAG